ncbi:unnamed protein product [Moneuplotes crassus]|uniref:C2H2-type domain-containing protein n=1 Tax=Euplotes crassus TaxID=5936 RepID=A0AAD1UHK5_EUPCR|nr:unnamed protein product [Moneuplotes crassus]
MAYRCEECDKEFTKKSHYDRHTVTHTQERKYKCPECDKLFKRRDHMTRHKNMVHSDEARKFKCSYPDCLSNGFIDNYHLRRHIKSCHEEKYVCKICEEETTMLPPGTEQIKFRFKKKKQLAKHMEQIHENSNKKECKYCNKLISKRQYQAHIKKHEHKIEKNMIILDITEKSSEVPLPKAEEHKQPEEKKETDFEDKQLQEKILSLQARKEDSVFMAQFRKRFKSSDSEHSYYKYDNINSRPSSMKLNSPNLQSKKSEPETLFNDSSVKDYFEKRVNEVKSSPKRIQKYLCQEPGCLKAFSSEYNLRVHIKTAHLKIREFKCKLCSNEYLHKKNLVEHIKRDHPGFFPPSDEESAQYRFPLYGLTSQKGSISSDHGNISPTYNPSFNALSQPKSVCSGSDREMFKETLKMDLSIKEIFSPK